MSVELRASSRQSAGKVTIHNVTGIEWAGPTWTIEGDADHPKTVRTRELVVHSDDETPIQIVLYLDQGTEDVDFPRAPATRHQYRVDMCDPGTAEWRTVAESGTLYKAEIILEVFKERLGDDLTLWRVWDTKTSCDAHLAYHD